MYAYIDIFRPIFPDKYFAAAASRRAIVGENCVADKHYLFFPTNGPSENTYFEWRRPSGRARHTAGVTTE